MTQQATWSIAKQNQPRDRTDRRPVFPLDHEAQRTKPLIPFLVSLRHFPVVDDSREVVHQPRPAQIAQPLPETGNSSV